MSFRTPFTPLLATAPSLAAAQAAAPDMGSSALQVILGLGVVLALLFASLWILKRLSAPRGQAAGLLKVVTAAAVGTRERVVVVEVGDTWLVLGVAPGQVTALHQMPRQAMAEGVTPSGEFADRLKQLLGRQRENR